MVNVTNLGLTERIYYIYIITNTANEVLYTGVTSNLIGRCVEHREKKYSKSFTARYNANKLVYYEEFPDIESAIDREKQIKAGSRKKKVALIENKNPLWLDLFETKLGGSYL